MKWMRKLSNTISTVRFDEMKKRLRDGSVLRPSGITFLRAALYRTIAELEPSAPVLAEVPDSDAKSFARLGPECARGMAFHQAPNKSFHLRDLAIAPEGAAIAAPSAPNRGVSTRFASVATRAAPPAVHTRSGVRRERLIPSAAT